MRGLLLELWGRTRMDWGFVTDRLSTTFRKERWIGSHDRRFVAETLYGMVRHLRRIDTGLAAGARRGASLGDLDRLLAYLVVEKDLLPEEASVIVPGIDWKIVAGIDDVIAQERNVTKRIALSASMPDWLAARFVADWGDKAEALAHGLNERAPMTVRTNTLKTTRDELLATLAKDGLRADPGAWTDEAVIFDSRVNLFGLAAFTAGSFEAQDEGSQLLAKLAVDAGRSAVSAGFSVGKPPTLVVDLCAGAGGKTLAIAAHLQNRGRVIAGDVDTRKLEELKRRARRAGVSNHQTAAIDIDTRGPVWPVALESARDRADVVFVDAPCSGIGALRRNPEARWRLRENDLEDFAARQRDILKRAVTLVKPGGVLVYATCTVLRVENQAVIEDVLKRTPELSHVPLSQVWGEAKANQLGDGKDMIVTPDRHRTDGFFASVMRRT